MATDAEILATQEEVAAMEAQRGQAAAVARWAASLNASGLWPDCSACAEAQRGDCIDYSDCIDDAGRRLSSVDCSTVEPRPYVPA